jgi:hypothetical protein
MLHGAANRIRDVPTDVDVMPLPRALPNAMLKQYAVNVSTSGGVVTAHVASILDPRFFRVELPEGGVPNLAPTSATATYRGCTYATNGGFFVESSGACNGSLVVNGSLVCTHGGLRANFALTNVSVVTGRLSLADLTSGALGFTTLIQGAGWLVRGGLPYANESLAAGEMTQRFFLEMVSTPQ